MTRSYWSKTLQSRLSRRRALAATGMGGLGAALLAACGGDDDEPSAPAPATQPAQGQTGAAGPTGAAASGLVYTPVDTTGQAVKGGVRQDAQVRDVLHYDPLTGGSFPTFGHANHAYQRLVYFKEGTIDELPDGSVEGDAVASWEFADEGTTVVFKLRPDNKLDPRPPTSNRPLTSADVKFSWDRFSEHASARGVFLNSISPDAPILDVTYPDDLTVVMKLTQPFASLLPMFGTNYYFLVLPMEAADQADATHFDIKQDMRGTGAWMLTEHTRSVGWKYERNPNWFRAKERPFLDGIDYALLPDPATRQAQFEAGTLWSFEPQADLALTIKENNPDVQMQAESPFFGNIGYLLIGMSKKSDSPWEKDERLRQALSMLIDRDAWIDTFFNVPAFESEGIPMEVGHHSHVPCSYPEVWLNPAENELGSESKYLQFLPDEAEKLLQAAGAYGMEADFTYWTPGWEVAMDRKSEVIAQMWQAAGHFKINQKVEDYQNVITPNFTFSKGQYDGITVHPFGTWSDFGIGMWNTFTPSGRNDYVGHDYPTIKPIMERHRAELDPEKRLDIIHDWQREMAKVMPLIPFPGFATSFTLNWPWLANVGYYEPWGGGAPVQETWVHHWYDKSKDPNAS